MSVLLFCLEIMQDLKHLQWSSSIINKSCAQELCILGLIECRLNPLYSMSFFSERLGILWRHDGYKRLQMPSIPSKLVYTVPLQGYAESWQCQCPSGTIGSTFAWCARGRGFNSQPVLVQIQSHPLTLFGWRNSNAASYEVTCNNNNNNNNNKIISYSHNKKRNIRKLLVKTRIFWHKKNGNVPVWP